MTLVLIQLLLEMVEMLEIVECFLQVSAKVAGPKRESIDGYQ